MTKSAYDVVILGAGHNGLVAAAYLTRAGLSVLLLEKNDYVGGAVTSQKVFPDYDAYLSRYSYLVSLFPEKIMQDLGLEIELRSRNIASFTPYLKNGVHGGLLLSNLSDEASRRSMLELTGSNDEFEKLKQFYELSRVFAEKTWDTMLQPLRSREELKRSFQTDTVSREAWRSLVEEPLGRAIERYLKNDVVRGLVFTDAKIGVFTHPYDESLLQNRCFLYHLIGNKTGEWKVPVGGMGRVAVELEKAARKSGAEILTNVRVSKLSNPSGNTKQIEYYRDGRKHTVDARFVLCNFGTNELAKLLDKPFSPDRTHEGSVFKINMLLHKLPKLKSGGHVTSDAFRGTFHIDEGYEEMKQSFEQASQNRLPGKLPCEVYCHTLTDDSILSPELRAKGFHTMTLFGIDTPYSLFAKDNENMRREAERRFIDGLNSWLAEPLENCLARARDGSLCIESKSPVDIEEALGLYKGNIFQTAPSFPFADTSDQVGTWGVETEYANVFLCGSSAHRGGAVSGIPGHNAAMKVLETVGGDRTIRAKL